MSGVDRKISDRGGVGYSLPFSRRDGVATIGIHVCVALLSVVVTVLLLRQVPSGSLTWQTPFIWILLCAQLLVAASATVLSGLAVRGGHSYDETDTWDHLTSLSHLALAIGGTYLIGGVTSPMWFGIAVLVGYTANLMTGPTGLGPLFAVPIAAAGAVSVHGQWTQPTTSLAVGLVAGLGLLFWYTRVVAIGLYGQAETNMWERNRLARRVDVVAEPLELAAQGDLSMAGRLRELTEDGQGDEDQLARLIGAFDHTLGSLRTLVGRVRSGGDQIGSAAEQVLVAAREQAASASQQSSAVSETTATIEELAATAAQIAETVGAGGGVCVGDVGVCGAGSGGGGGFGGCDGFDCVSGGSDCVSCFGVGGEGAGDWSDFGGD